LTVENPKGGDMDTPRPGRRYTPEEYLAFERQSPYKHEYIDG
jgi:hypothetical protein